MYLTTSMSITRLSHIYRGNIYVNNLVVPLFKVKGKIYNIKKCKIATLLTFPKTSVKFGTNFTKARKKFTQALLARLNVFASVPIPCRTDFFFNQPLLVMRSLGEPQSTTVKVVRVLML